jgi:hypothetical protein
MGLGCLSWSLPCLQGLREKDFYEVRKCPLIFARQNPQLLFELRWDADSENFIW